MDSQPALVTADPEVCGGRPCFAGHRVPIKMVLRRLNARERLADMQGDFPWLTAAHIARRAHTWHFEPAKHEIRFGLLKS